MQTAMGIDPTRVDTTQQFPLGYEIGDPRSGTAPANVIRYLKAGSAISAGNTVIVDVTSSIEPGVVIPSSALNQVIAGIAETAIPNGSFGWVTVKGRVGAATKTASTM